MDGKVFAHCLFYTSLCWLAIGPNRSGLCSLGACDLKIWNMFFGREILIFFRSRYKSVSSLDWKSDFLRSSDAFATACGHYKIFTVQHGWIRAPIAPPTPSRSRSLAIPAFELVSHCRQPKASPCIVSAACVVVAMAQRGGPGSWEQSELYRKSAAAGKRVVAPREGSTAGALPGFGPVEGSRGLPPSESLDAALAAALAAMLERRGSSVLGCNSGGFTFGVQGNGEVDFQLPVAWGHILLCSCSFDALIAFGFMQCACISCFLLQIWSFYSILGFLCVVFSGKRLLPDRSISTIWCSSSTNDANPWHG